MTPDDAGKTSICTHVGHRVTSYQHKQGWVDVCLVNDGPHVYTTFKNEAHTKRWVVDKGHGTICNADDGMCLRFNAHRGGIDAVPVRNVPLSYFNNTHHRDTHRRSRNVFWDVDDDGRICLLPDRDICMQINSPDDPPLHLAMTDQSRHEVDIISYSPSMERTHGYGATRWTVA
jgi:hypothetical protein